MYNIYDCLDDGDSVHEVIKDMSIAEMEDFFADADPCAFL